MSLNNVHLNGRFTATASAVVIFSSALSSRRRGGMWSDVAGCGHD